MPGITTVALSAPKAEYRNFAMNRLSFGSTGNLELIVNATARSVSESLGQPRGETTWHVSTKNEV